MAGEIRWLLHMILPPTLIEIASNEAIGMKHFSTKYNLGLHWPTFIPKPRKKTLSEFLSISSGHSRLFLLSFKSCYEQPGFNA